MSGEVFELSLVLHELGLKQPWESRRGKTTSRWSLVVEVHGDGVRGLGEAPLPLRVSAPMGLAREAAVRLPRLRLGEVWAAREALDQAGLPTWLRHGVLAALVDHAARCKGVSFARYLADVVDSPGIPVSPHWKPGDTIGVNGNLGPLSPEDTAAHAERLVGEGFSTIKVKSLGDAAADAERLRAIRSAVGPDVFLRLDANGAWAPGEALDALRHLAPFSLQYVEEPLGEGSLQERVRLAQKSPVTLAWDESITGADAAWALAPTAAALVVKPPRLGGVDRFLGVLAAARDAATPIVVSTPLEGAVGRAVDLQLAALVPTGFAHGLGTGSVFTSDLAQPAMVPERGHVRLPEGAGIGALRTKEGLVVRRRDAGFG